MLKNLGFNLEQFQQNMNLLLIGESFAPIKKLKIIVLVFHVVIVKRLYF